MNIQELAANYKIDQSGIDIVRNSRTVFVVGIVAAGKDTIVNNLLKQTDYHLIVSHTTRQPRTNNGVLERDGIDYHFVSFDEMARLLADHKMIEVNNFGGNYYGTSVEEIARANADGKIAITDIDVHGATAYTKISPDSIKSIFIIPPDYQTWLDRLKKRYVSADDVFADSWQTRRDITINELEYALESPNYIFVINDDLGVAVQQVDDIAHGKIYQDINSQDLAKTKARELLEAIRHSS